MLKAFVVNTGVISGKKFIGGKNFDLIKANEQGIVFPKSLEDENHILNSNEYLTGQISEIALDKIGKTGENVLNDTVIGQLSGVLTPEQISHIQGLPKEAKTIIAENIDSILNTYKTKENTKVSGNPVKIIPVGGNTVNKLTDSTKIKKENKKVKETKETIKN